MWDTAGSPQIVERVGTAGAAQLLCPLKARARFLFLGVDSSFFQVSASAYPY